MTFFNWSGDGGKGRVSSYLWIYIVVTAFFTAGTIGMWYFVVIYRRTNCAEIDPEKQSIQGNRGMSVRIIDARDRLLEYWLSVLNVCFCIGQEVRAGKV
jgi:hypothetical protein